MTIKLDPDKQYFKIIEPVIIKDDIPMMNHITLRLKDIYNPSMTMLEAMSKLYMGMFEFAFTMGEKVSTGEEVPFLHVVGSDVATYVTEGPYYRAGKPTFSAIPMIAHALTVYHREWLSEFIPTRPTLEEEESK